MRTFVILAAHGSPPNDFPKKEMGEFFMLHAQKEMDRKISDNAETKYIELESRIRNWQRNSKNDPFYTACLEIAANMEKELLLPVFVGFNEFCAPTINDAIEGAIEQGAEKVVVISPMMTRGGEHTEVDIPGIIKDLQGKYPQVKFIYAYPFLAKEIARFLASQVKKFDPQGE